ncbi:MAG: AAA family ATPase [Clostridiales bacterium]|nr:AAA family ATPase [Clostridiales bacterium]
MKILGFEIQISSDIEEQAYLDAISSVMENPRISIDSGKEIIRMLIDNQLTKQQLFRYIEKNNSNTITQAEIFEHLDRWQETVGPFSTYDMLYLNSRAKTSEYKVKSDDIQSIVSYISQRVIGQDDAIRSIVTAAWLHCTSVRKNLGIKVPAQLLIGQTGVGKTQILNLLSEVLNVPIINIFASTITAPGYKGGDSLIDQIFSQYNDSLDAMEGPVIIIIHEIDKTVRGNNDGYRVELLSSIMSIIEKSVIHKSSALGGIQSLDLNNVLVLFDGCFEGIEKIVARRLGLGQVGFNQGSHNGMHDLRAKIQKIDLLGYGMMKEFIGRVSNPICLNCMTSDLMYDILTQSVDSPIATYISAFKHYGIDLRFSTGAIKAIANFAFENGEFGARSIETVVSELMQPYTMLLTSNSKKNILIDKREVSRLIGKNHNR